MRCLVDSSTFEATIQAGLDHGINHLETARGYGQSEIMLGQCLSKLQRHGHLSREQVVITTKIPPHPDAATMERQIDASLERLQLDRIDFLAIHGINTSEHLAWIKADRGCMRAARLAIDDGRLGHIGFSTHGSHGVIEAAIQTDQFDFVNLHYGLFFQHHASVVRLAASKDLGIFIISPADKGGKLYAPPAKLKQLCAPYSPLEVAYRWLLRQPAVTTLSVGPSNPQELSLPLTLAKKIGNLSAQEQAILERLERRKIDALGGDLCSQCYECLPCPEAIHIPEVLRLRNLTVAYDMQEFGQYRYRMFENAGHWFPGRKGNRCTDCGDCLPRCPDKLDIPSLLRDTHSRLNGPGRRRLWDD